eukprot:9329571-Pyramimonas_sp.AAC.1
MITIDVLHCLDLGVSQDILGNLFWEAIASKGFFSETTQEKRVDQLLLLVKEHYKECRTPVRVN